MNTYEHLPSTTLPYFYAFCGIKSFQVGER